MTPIWSVRVTSEPAAEPVTVAEAKAYLRIDHDDEDDLFTEWIKAARAEVEAWCGRSLVTQTRQLKLDCFPGRAIELPYPPVQSVSSVAYVDTAGDTQTWGASNYVVDLHSLPPRLDAAYGIAWPTTRDEVGAVAVTYVAGYGAASAVPSGIKLAIKSLVGDFHEHREATTEGRLEKNEGIVRVLRRHRVRWYV